MRFALAVFGVAVLHFFASFMAMLMAETKGGGWCVPRNILLLPLYAIPVKWIPNGAVGWAIWASTSLAWGWMICAAIVRFARPGN